MYIRLTSIGFHNYSNEGNVANHHNEFGMNHPVGSPHRQGLKPISTKIMWSILILGID